MTSNIVPGTWIVGEWCFYLYEQPEDAVFIFTREMQQHPHLQKMFFAHLASLSKADHEGAVETTIIQWTIDVVYDSIAFTTAVAGGDHDLATSFVGYRSAELFEAVTAATATSFEDTTNTINSAATHAGVKSVQDDVCHLPAGAAAPTLENTQHTKAAKVITEIAKIWHSAMEKEEKSNKCWNAIQQLVCGGNLTFAERCQRMLVVDKTTMLSIPLIKVLFSKNKEVKMGWIPLFPLIEQKMQIINLSD
jgi:hypothetical protein